LKATSAAVEPAGGNVGRIVSQQRDVMAPGGEGRTEVEDGAHGPAGGEADLRDVMCATERRVGIGAVCARNSRTMGGVLAGH
jgi:hypothetical protein